MTKVFKAQCPKPVTPRNTPKLFLNIIRVYYKCILKFFAIIILLSEKISNSEISKGKFVTCQNGTQNS